MDGDGSRPPPDSEQPDEGEGTRSRIDAFVAPLFEETALWPMLLVIVLVMITFVSSLLLLALTERNFFAMAAVAGLVYLSLPAIQSSISARRLGRGALLVGVLWGGSILAATVLRVNGLF